MPYIRGLLLRDFARRKNEPAANRFALLLSPDTYRNLTVSHKNRRHFDTSATVLFDEDRL